MRRTRVNLRAVVTGLFLCLPPVAALAQCDFEVGFHGIDDRAILQTFRCLNTEILRLKRDRARLERRLAEFERLTEEIPAEFINLDGEITEDPGRPIRRARFRLTPPSTGRAGALPIDQRVLEELCGASGGCLLSLTFREFGLRSDRAQSSVPTGPCQFSYSGGSGAWAIAEGCGADDVRSGIDGERGALSGQQGAIIAEVGGACVLAESEMSRSSGNDTLATDTSRGLFLLSIPSRRPGSVPRFDCALVLN